MPTTIRIDNLLLTDRWIEAPLDHADPTGQTIRVHAREVVCREKVDADLPWAVFLQGGPGFGGPRPTANDGWMKTLLEEHRLLLLDGRGTGRSYPLTAQTLARLPTDEQARHLACCRADAIVRDAEAFRRELAGDKPWLAVGQSYGGWCITTYLSFFPEGLSGAIFAGGLPPVGWSAEDVYRANYPMVQRKCDELFDRFPAARERLTRIAEILRREPARLPRGGRLTVLGLQFLGMHLYRSGGAEDLNYLLEEAMVDDDTLAESFLRRVENAFPMDGNPIFALLHEAIYADGPGATAWAAQRVRSEFPAFAPDADPLLLTGEMIYPWMFDDLVGLRPLKDAAERLAEKSDWPRLYDLEQLAANTVPAAAVVYYNDMCVGRDYTLDCAAKLGNLKTWVTSEYEHNGIGIDGERIMQRLLKLMRGDAAR